MCVARRGSSPCSPAVSVSSSWARAAHVSQVRPSFIIEVPALGVAAAKAFGLHGNTADRTPEALNILSDCVPG